jgi:hypothetical protein
VLEGKIPRRRTHTHHKKEVKLSLNLYRGGYEPPSGLVVDQLGNVGTGCPGNEAEVKVQRFRDAIGAFVFEHAVGFPDRCDYGRRNRIDRLRQFDVMTINRLTPQLVGVGRIPDLESKFISSRTEEIFRTVRILIDSSKNLRNRVDCDGDRISESHVYAPWLLSNLVV